MRHIAVVIEVIACQVGKSRSSDRHAVEPELIEAVAGGFDRHMLDPLPRQIREIAMQRYGVRCGQSTGLTPYRGYQTERAEACCRSTDRRPDFARAVAHRGSAVVARDG